MDRATKETLLDTIQVLLYWLLTLASVSLALYYRRNRSSGWTLYKLIFGAIVCQTAYYTMWAVHNAAVRSLGYGSLTDNLYRICIPLNQLATASFMGLLLVLAAGYCITRNNLGDYKVQVVGLPVLIFVTGTVTQYINFQLLEATSDQLDVLDMAAWEAGLFAVCTFLNVAAFLFWVVYIFEIIQVEVDALRAQQELNLVRNAAPSATVAPFPGSFEPAEATHAALPPGVDPDWARAAAEEGVVAYKNLLGPRQNMSHIPGADVEAQEITTVADMLNFETKKTMYKRFSTGFGVFMIAQLCVLLAPVFIIDVVQEVITVFQFLVVLGFLAALLWLFRPLQDSPYLLMGDDLSHLDTALGVEEPEEEVVERAMHNLAQNGYARANGRANGASVGVELSSQPVGGLKRSTAGGANGAGNSSRTVTWAPAGDGSGGRDQSGGGSSGAAASSAALPASSSASDFSGAPAGLMVEPPVRLPAIRTSIGSAAQQQQQQQQPGGSQQQQQGGAAAAAANGLGSAGPQFLLGDEDELHEIKLHSHSPTKRD